MKSTSPNTNINEIEDTKNETTSSGLSAIYLPRLSTKDQWGDDKPLNEEDTLSTLNIFLEDLNQKGLDIKAVLPIRVEVPSIKEEYFVEDNEDNTTYETRHIAIVGKRK